MVSSGVRVKNSAYVRIIWVMPWHLSSSITENLGAIPKETNAISKDFWTAARFPKMQDIVLGI